MDDDYIIDSTTVGDYVVEVISDDDGGEYNDPRQWDNLGIMYCYHKRYTLGDEELSNKYDTDDYSGWEEFESQLVKDGHILIMPLGLYDHSGITMYIGNSHDRWDGGGIGFICTTKERVRKWFSVKHITNKVLEEAKSQLENEVSLYDSYIRGEVYVWRIKKNGEFIDSCGGYLGDYKECLEDGISEAKSYQENDRKARINQVKTWVKHHVPLEKRMLAM